MIYYFILLVSTVLEIVEKVTLSGNTLEEKSYLIILSPIVRVFSIGIELPLVYLQWWVFVYFIKKKQIQTREH